MSPELVGLLITILIVLWLHHEWHLRRYPDRACRGCGGSGKATSQDILGRRVIGPCWRCQGIETTTPRRRWSK